MILPCDAMHKRDLCRRALHVCLSVRLGVCPSRSCIVSKRVNITSNFFVGSPHHSVFSRTKPLPYSNILSLSLMWASNASGGCEKSWFLSIVSLYFRNDARYGHSYCRMSTGNRTSFRTVPFSMTLNAPNPDFKSRHYLMRNISETVRDRYIVIM